MIDLKANEERILAYWEKNAVNKMVAERNGGGKDFYFLEGPPYASGTLASHHIWVYTIKDIMLRYKRYRGFNVHDRAGYDVHGLPIENKVERNLKVTSKKDIEERIGIGSFVSACRDYAAANIDNAVAAAKRFGVSLDFDNLYLPYYDAYINAGWGIFKRMHEKGLLYKGRSSIAYCPHCETALSAQGPEVEYSNDTDSSIFVRFKAKASDYGRMDIDANTYLVIWTTTPWTLPANVTIAANPRSIYVKAILGGTTYIVAKDRLDALAKATGESAIVKAEFTGSELEGVQYESPLEKEVPHQKKLARYHKVVCDEGLVSTVEGTGLVHIAPGHGPEDYKLGKKLSMPAFCPVGLDAKYTDEAGKYAGLSVPGDANRAVLADVRQSGDLLLEGSVTHSYPHCWRCDSKLIYIVTDQWFINTQRLKKRMISENAKIKWHPSRAVDWQRDAIESSPDWCISRQRYWGTPIPIWSCNGCGTFEVIGSAEELAERGRLHEPPKNLHRPHVDGIKIKCPKCNGEMSRINDIFDVWYDSGIAHTASLSQGEFDRLFPADWITESRDQIRGWFMVLLRTSVAIYGKTPFLEANIGGIIFDELGNEMHRHLGNAVNAIDLISIVSADGYRLWCSSHPRWQDLKLKKQELTEADRNMLTLYNMAELAKEIAMLSGADIKNPRIPSSKSMAEEDRWILSRFNSLVRDVTAHLDAYEIDDAVNEMKHFMLEDMSRFYLKFAKQRAAEAGKREITAISNIISYILKNLVIMQSIVTPFASESIYLELFSAEGESVFLNGWPTARKSLLDSRLEEDFRVMEEASNAILALREKYNIKLRQPLASAAMELTSDSAVASVQRLSRLIESYTNVHSIKATRSAASARTLRPVFQKLGPDFKENAKLVAEAIASADAEDAIKAIDNGGTYTLHTERGAFQVNATHFAIVEGAAAQDSTRFKYGSVSIDTNITEELKEELLVREVTRNIQMLRKKANLTRLDKVNTHISAADRIRAVLEKNTAQIRSITRSATLRLSEKQPADRGASAASAEIVVLDNTITISISIKAKR